MAAAEESAVGTSPRRHVYLVAGRSSVCFFETVRTWVTCPRSDQQMPSSKDARHSVSLRAQGLFHLLFCTLPLITLPVIYTFYRLVPPVSRYIAQDLVAYIGGIKNAAPIEHVASHFLSGLLFLLAICTLAALLTTSIRDPGRVPRGYHWIATAASRRGSSKYRQQTADWTVFLPTFPDSSFAPALHATPHYGSRLYKELTKHSVLTVTTGGGITHKHAYMIPAKPVNEWITYLQRNEVASRPTCSTAADDQCRVDTESQRVTIEAAGVPTEVLAKVNNVDVLLKWCTICRHVRLPRTRHCRNCQCCVDRFDHHCVWVCNCVGLRNHRYFFAFVTLTFLLDVYIALLSVVAIKHEWWLTANSPETANSARLAIVGYLIAVGSHWWHVVSNIPGAVALCTFTALMLIPLGNLALFHFVLLGSNRTTTEEMREQNLMENPYSQGTMQNLLWLLWKRPPPSLMDRWGQIRVISSRGWRSSSSSSLMQAAAAAAAGNEETRHALCEPLVSDSEVD